MDAFKAQKAIELSLRAQGITWRAVELAVADQVKGDWRRLDQVRFPSVVFEGMIAA